MLPCASTGDKELERGEKHPLHSQAGSLLPGLVARDSPGLPGRRAVGWRGQEVSVFTRGDSLLPLVAAVRTPSRRAMGLMWEDLLASTPSPRFTHILTTPHPFHQGLRKASWGQGCAGGTPRDWSPSCPSSPSFILQPESLLRSHKNGPFLCKGS